MGEGECRTQTLFCCCCKEKFVVVFVFHMKLERCVFFLFLFFLRIFENRLLMILFCNVQRTKLFVDSGVNLGGNDSLFSTGGKNSALQTKIWQNFNYQKHSRFKGQLISKGLFLSSILPKTYEKKNRVELFSFVFWENWRHQKDISKLTDL